MSRPERTAGGQVLDTVWYAAGGEPRSAPPTQPLTLVNPHRPPRAAESLAFQLLPLFNSTSCPLAADPLTQFLRWSDSSAGPDACHPWRGPRHRGYGMMVVDGRPIGAHRWILGHVIGRPLVADEFACHKCDFPLCTSWRCLYVGDAKTNADDARRRTRTVPPSRHIPVVDADDPWALLYEWLGCEPPWWPSPPSQRRGLTEADLPSNHPTDAHPSVWDGVDR